MRDGILDKACRPRMASFSVIIYPSRMWGKGKGWRVKGIEWIGYREKRGDEDKGLEGMA